jgi:V8-like Glu-specific endopeptidase
VIDVVPDDRRKLVLLLRDVPELATESSRRTLLGLAGLEAVAPSIDVSGSPFEAVATIVLHLNSYGRTPAGPHALGLFLNLVKELVGPDRRRVLDDVLHRYQLMVPAAETPPVDTWHGPAGDIAEKIINSNTLRPIAFLAGAVAAARAVAYLEAGPAGQRWSGSGFLVGPDLLLTNNHVLPTAELLPDAVFRFNYQDDVRGRAEPTHDFRAAADVFATSRELDYTLVRLDGRPGDEWGFLPLRQAPVAVGDRVNIIQHPGGQPKQIALRDNVVEYVGGGVAQYVTSTLPGSSGSPVLTDTWEVCALHHAGGVLREPTTARMFFRNEGVMIEEILRDLPATVRDLLSDNRTEAA